MAKKHWKCNLLLGAGALTAAAGGAYWAIGNKMFDMTLSRKAAQGDWSPGEDPGAAEPDLEKDPYYQMREDGKAWYREQPVEKVHIFSPRGERLHADMLLSEKPSNVWVISLHGFRCSPEIDGVIVQVFHDWGYNVLCPYLCGHGESEARYVSMGWHDRIDTVAWAEYLVREFGDVQIVLHGISMGGATVMMTTGENLPKQVICAVEDCGYSSVWDIFAVQAREMMNYGTFPFLYAADTVTKRKAGFGLKEASCVEQLKKSKTPTLFIHGDKDDFVPFWMLSRVYESAACEKQQLVIPGAAHAEAAGKDPELYFGTVKAFIEKYMEKGNGTATAG